MAPSTLISKFPLHEADRDGKASLSSFLDKALMGNTVMIDEKQVEVRMPNGERQTQILSFNSNSINPGLPGRLTFYPDPDPD
jgi:hypothetical protein